MEASNNTLVQFGAGNIGRSFLGQLFSRGGYEVIFIDVDDRLVNGLNAEGRYRVVIKHGDKPDESLWIENVRAIHGKDVDAVAEAVAGARVAATSVGQRALPAVLPTLAKGLKLRYEQHGDDSPLDIILAENLHGAAQFVKGHLRELLSRDFPLDDVVGLVETSIGKMVPIMRDEDVATDPLWVFAEPYNRLIVDGRGFLAPVPRIEGLRAVDNIAAYVDRKLFIHNLGHSASAYLGYRKQPEHTFIYEVLDDAKTLESVRRCMMQSAVALQREYPDEFTMETLEAHVDDLLSRFRNRALEDTVHRVGRDLYRKLGKSDRLVGAMFLAKRHGCPCDAIAAAIAAGTEFRKGDEHGDLFPNDADFAKTEYPQGLEHILTAVCGLSRDLPEEKNVIDAILGG